MRIILVVMLALSIGRPVAAVAAEAPEPAQNSTAGERPYIVLLGPVNGMLPAHPDNSRAFMASLRDAFEAEFYLTEVVTNGPAPVSMALANKFRLVQGEPFGDEWQVRVTIDGWSRTTADGVELRTPGPSRRYTVADTLEHLPRGLADDSTRHGPPGPEAEFPPDSLWRVEVSVVVLPPGAVESGEHPVQVAETLSFASAFTPRPAWFSHMGHAVGLIALEALHRQSGDLEPGTRLRIDHTAREPVETMRSEP